MKAKNKNIEKEKKEFVNLEDISLVKNEFMRRVGSEFLHSFLSDELKLVDPQKITKAWEFIKELEKFKKSERKGQRIVKYEKYNQIYGMLYFNNYFINLVYGAMGSGKTYGIAQNILKEIIEEDDVVWWVIRITREAHNNSTIEDFKAVIENENLENDVIFSSAETNKDIKMIKSNNTNSVVYFHGANREEGIKGMRGANRIWVEECTELSLKKLTYFETRLKNVERPKVIYSFNPSDSAQFDVKKFIEGNKKRKAFILHLGPRDNIFTDEQYFNQIDSLKYLDESIHREAMGLIESESKEETPQPHRPIIVQKIKIRRDRDFF